MEGLKKLLSLFSGKNFLWVLVVLDIVIMSTFGVSDTTPASGQNSGQDQIESNQQQARAAQNSSQNTKQNQAAQNNSQNTKQNQPAQNNSQNTKQNQPAQSSSQATKQNQAAQNNSQNTKQNQPAQKSQPAQKQSTATTHSQQSPKQSSAKQGLLWGIDTASLITQSFYKCVENQYGKPSFAGRYLGDKPGVSAGITSQEAKRLHNNGTKIMPIYNHITDATGRTKGQQAAQEAIKYAKNLGIPSGVTIFVDIEPSYPVNSAFLIGWTESMLKSKYQPGVYGEFKGDEVRGAYQNAAANSQDVKSNLVIWSNMPRPGISSKQKAPTDFQADTPNKSMTMVWQYGLQDQKCNIDTNIIKKEFSTSLW